MAGHVFGSLLCLAIAAMLGSVVKVEWNDMPGWVLALGIGAAAVLVVCAWHLFMRGWQRKQMLEGPRTRIVMTGLPEPPKRVKNTSDARRQSEGDSVTDV